ncbi:MAG: hypothetical protein NHG06_00375 [Candidatus Shikimatogenerans sp. JK-2022]|nr:hypothetical protein [Candidatus Shikimatogenerans bostrichidophilus]
MNNYIVILLIFTLIIKYVITYKNNINYFFKKKIKYIIKFSNNILINKKPKESFINKNNDKLYKIKKVISGSNLKNLEISTKKAYKIRINYCLTKQYNMLIK